MHVESVFHVPRACRRPLVGIFALAVVMRLAGIVYAHAAGIQLSGYESEAIARNLVAGLGYAGNEFGAPHPTAYQYPVYTLLMAASFLVSPQGYLPIQLLQALLGAASCVGVFLLARRLMSSTSTAMLAALLMAVDPLQSYWAARPQALTLEVFLLVLLLLVFIHASAVDTMRAWAAAGVVLGVCVLSKSAYVVLLLPLGLHVLVSRGWDVLAVTRGFAVSGVCMAAVMSPWVIRNAVTLGAFVPFTTNGALTLWIAHNPDATGEAFAADGRMMVQHIPAPLLDAVRGADDLGQQRLFAEAARAYIREDPWRAVRGVPARLRATWWFERYVPSQHDVLRKVRHVALVSIAAVGAWLARRRWRAWVVFPLSWVVLSCVYAVFYGSARFRYLVEFSFIVLAAEAAAAWLRPRILRAWPAVTD